MSHSSSKADGFNRVFKISRWWVRNLAFCSLLRNDCTATGSEVPRLRPLPVEPGVETAILFQPGTWQGCQGCSYINSVLNPASSEGRPECSVPFVLSLDYTKPDSFHDIKVFVGSGSVLSPWKVSVARVHTLPGARVQTLPGAVCKAAMTSLPSAIDPVGSAVTGAPLGKLDTTGSYHADSSPVGSLGSSGTKRLLQGGLQILVTWVVRSPFSLL